MKLQMLHTIGWGIAPSSHWQRPVNSYLRGRCVSQFTVCAQPWSEGKHKFCCIYCKHKLLLHYLVPVCWNVLLGWTIMPIYFDFVLFLLCLNLSAKAEACYFRLAALMYFTATMPMERRMKTFKDEHIGCWKSKCWVLRQFDSTGWHTGS